MKKKLFAILLAAVMVTALLPTMAFADPEDANLNAYSVTVGQPVAGQKLDYVASAVADPTGAIVENSVDVTWYKLLATSYSTEDKNEWTKVTDPEELASSDYLYDVEVKTELTKEYSLSDSAVIKLNNTELTKSEKDVEQGYLVDDGYVMMYGLFNCGAAEKTQVDQFSALVNEPEAGKTLNINGVSVSDPEDSVLITNVTWYKILASDYKLGGQNEWSLIENPEQEVASSIYRYEACVEAEIQDGYELGEDTWLTLNGVQLQDLKGNTEIGYVEDDGHLFLYNIFDVTAQTKYLTKFWTIISVPQVGKTLDFAPQADIEPQGSIAIQGVTWFKVLKDQYGTDDETWVEVKKDEVADAKYLYAPAVECLLGEDYAIAEDASIKLNGKLLKEADETSDSGYFVSETGAVIVTDVYEPLAADAPSTDGNPKTGDNNSMFLWIALMAAGAAGAVFAGKKKFSGR